MIHTFFSTFLLADFNEIKGTHVGDEPLSVEVLQVSREHHQ